MQAGAASSRFDNHGRRSGPERSPGLETCAGQSILRLLSGRALTMRAKRKSSGNQRSTDGISGPIQDAATVRL